MLPGWIFEEKTNSLKINSDIGHIIFICFILKRVVRLDKKMVLIEDIVNALEGVMDDWEQYLNTETGEILSLPSSDNYYIDREPEDEELAEEIEYSDKYVRLPNQYDIHEYNIMEDFAYAAPNQKHEEKLLRALHGRKPYRHFKDEINYLGIDDAYYAYRLLAFCRMAKEWCERYEIPFDSKNDDLKRLCEI